MAFVWCALGLLLLIGGAELVVRGGTHVAARFGVSPLVIGLTFVAIGTSAPELAVGIDSALRGQGDLAVGNIAGTNVVNILLILGLSALLRPLAIQGQTVRFDLPAIVVASLLLLALAWDRSLTRIDGLVLTGCGIAYTLALLRVARAESRDPAPTLTDELVEEFDKAGGVSTGRSLAMLFAGIAVIVLGAEWLVDGAVALARQWRVSEAFIGLTIVAIGTSAPELVTTVISTIRNNRDIAIGNLLGSSIYNILIILGVTCLVPAQAIRVGPNLAAIDIPLMTAVAFVCVPAFVTGRCLSRLEGGLFVVAYGAYLSFLIATRS